MSRHTLAYSKEEEELGCRARQVAREAGLRPTDLSKSSGTLTHRNRLVLYDL